MEGGGREGGQSPRAKYEVSQRLTCLDPQPPHHTQDTGGGQKDTCDTTRKSAAWLPMMESSSFPQVRHLEPRAREGHYRCHSAWHSLHK